MAFIQREVLCSQKCQIKWSKTISWQLGDKCRQNIITLFQFSIYIKLQTSVISVQNVEVDYCVSQFCELTHNCASPSKSCWIV